MRRACSSSAVAIALAVCIGMAQTADAAILTATPQNFAAVFSGAQGGDTIELVAGDYGSFTGAAKPSTVTIRPQPGAVVTMSLDFSAARNIRIEGVTVNGADIRGSTADVAIVGSRFIDQAVVWAVGMVNRNIVFDADTFEGISVCGACHEGRITVTQSPIGSQPVGVTVTNSHFGGGGESDGIQAGAYGVVIGPGNTFEDIRQGSYARHVDAIQLYGQSHTVIVGNHFRRNSFDIMAPDGGEKEVITDNVFVHDGGQAIQMGGHIETVFAHNTLRNITVGPSGSRGSVLRDNVMMGSEFGSGCSGCPTSHNLFSSSGDASGSSSIVGVPKFVGGANPSTYAGFALAAGSPGKGNASDGLDRGVRFSAPVVPAPPLPAGPGAPSATTAPSVALKVRRSVTWAQLRRGLRVRITVRQRVKLRLALTRNFKRRSLARLRRTAPRAGTRTYVLRPTRARLGSRRAMRITLRVTATDSAGHSRTLRAGIRVRR
jgi:hypothetical protein